MGVEDVLTVLGANGLAGTGVGTKAGDGVSAGGEGLDRGAGEGTTVGDSAKDGSCIGVPKGLPD